MALVLSTSLDTDARSRDRNKKKAQSFKKSISKKFQRARNSVKKRVTRAKERTKKRAQEFQREVGRKKQQYKNAASQRYRRGKENLQRKSRESKKKFQTKVKKLDADLQTAKRKFGNRVSNAVNRIRRRYGPAAEKALVSYLSKTKKFNEGIIQRSQGAMANVRQWVKDPRKRKMAMTGVIVASAVAYYGYKHKDDLKYMAFKHGLQKVTVNVNGRAMTAEAAISRSILAQAPYLRGTSVAEDPAAVLAYGVTGLAKKDLMNNVALIPDRNGGMRSINESIYSVDDVDKAIAILNVSSSLEAMGMYASEHGHFGRYGQEFAASYGALEEQFGE